MEYFPYILWTYLRHPSGKEPSGGEKKHLDANLEAKSSLCHIHGDKLDQLQFTFICTSALEWIYGKCFMVWQILLYKFVNEKFPECNVRS